MATRSMAALCVAMVLFAQVFVQADAAPPLASRRTLLQAFAPELAPLGAPEVAPVESPEYAPELAPTIPPSAAMTPEISPAESPVAAGPSTFSPGPARMTSSASTTMVSSFSILIGFAASLL